MINPIAFKQYFDSTIQCDESEALFNQIVKVSAIALIGIAVVSADKFYAKGKELSRACYQAFQGVRISHTIQQELPIWKTLLGNLKLPLTNQAEMSYRRRQDTAPTLPASIELTEEIFDQYALKGPILELGSNLLNEKGESYLAQLLPAEHQKALSYSDYLPEVVKNESAKTKRSYLCLNATKLRKTLLPASQTNIVALNVIDTISRDKLARVVKGLHHSLKEGGRIVILSDLPFDQDPIFEKFSTEDNLVLPYIDGDDLGIKMIPQKVLLQRAQPFGEPFVQFLQRVMRLRKEQRARFMFWAFKLNLEIGVRLHDVLEKICKPEDFQRIDHKQSYIDDLTEAFTSDGRFEILTNAYKTSQKIINASMNNGHNVLASDLRVAKFIYPGHSPCLGKNEVLLKSVFHVMIAKKIKSQ